MGEHTIKLPDVGEGVAEAELVEWHVKVGDIVREDSVLGAVMTDKATVEIPSPVSGEVLWLGAEIGDTVAVGSPIIRLKVEGEGNAKETAAPKSEAPAPKAKPELSSPVVTGEVAAKPTEGAIDPPPQAQGRTIRVSLWAAAQLQPSAAGLPSRCPRLPP